MKARRTKFLRKYLCFVSSTKEFERLLGSTHAKTTTQWSLFEFDRRLTLNSATVLLCWIIPVVDMNHKSLFLIIKLKKVFISNFGVVPFWSNHLDHYLWLKNYRKFDRLRLWIGQNQIVQCVWLCMSFRWYNNMTLLVNQLGWIYPAIVIFHSMSFIYYWLLSISER